MGPFVPDFISDQLNLVVALIIGIAFGFVLEQAGFSSSRRLAGLFYGYDFSVLRVFFTAAVTAMSGILLLGHFGYLDVSAIYVNPTWLWPAIVGGVVMGAGFILGGYCPGTSIAAAAIGKIDAMFFVVGGVAGVLAFGEGYPLVATFFDSSSLGSIKVYDSLHMSQGAFAFLLIAVAIGAFAVTSLIEQKVNKDAPSRSHPATLHRVVAAAVLVLGVVLMVLPDRQQQLMATAKSPAYRQAHPVQLMSADELAFRLVDHDPRVQIYDLRFADAYKALALPVSTNIQLKDLMGRDLIPDLSKSHLKKVFVADTEEEALDACLVLTQQGYENVVALEGGFPKFQAQILSPEGATLVSASDGPDVTDFRRQARTNLLAQIAEAKKKGAGTKKVEKKIKGGC